MYGGVSERSWEEGRWRRKEGTGGVVVVAGGNFVAVGMNIL